MTRDATPAPPERDHLVDAVVARGLSSGSTPALGVAVAWGDGTRQHRTAGTADRRTAAAAGEGTLFHACSATKTVTALAVLRLADAGLVDLDADVDTVLGGWHLDRPAHGPAPTVAHLLSHTAGIDDAPGSFTPLADPVVVLDLLKGATPAHEGVVRAGRAPGTRFAYSDAGYAVVEHAIEQVTGMPVAAALDAWVLAPLGLGRSLLWEEPTGALGSVQVPVGRVGAAVLADAAAGHEPDGAVVAAGRARYPGLAGSGLWSTPGDLATLLSDLLAARHGSTSALLRPQSARRMLSPAGPEPYAGLGVFLSGTGLSTRAQTQGWGAGFQCAAVAEVSSRSVAVAMINADPGTDQASSVVGATLDAVTGSQWWA